MRNFIVMLLLGIVLFAVGAWSLGLFEEKSDVNPTPDGERRVAVVAKPGDLGNDLYPPAKYKPIELPRQLRTPIVIPGLMNAIETEEVPSPVQGRVLFVGDQVDDSAVLVAGSTAFLAEPYYFASVYTGRTTFNKFYRRHYEGDVVTQGQMLGMIEPSEALGDVLKEMTKISAARAEYEAAKASEGEGYNRFDRAEKLLAKKAIAPEEHGAAKLTWVKLKQERVVAEEKIKLAEVDKAKADTILHKHEIRAVMPYKYFTIKSIQRGAGAFLKQLDPVVMTVQSLERMMAEGQIEEQYFARLKNRKDVTATIEPTIIDAPIHEFPGHDKEVTSVAVSRDMKIVSGSEDGIVFIWTRNASAPVSRMDHEDPVRVVACTPRTSPENLCLVGCANGDLYLWNLEKDEATLVKDPIRKAHGNDASITSIAFSPDGEHFATGGSDGSIKIWITKEFVERYAFVPANGIEKCHEDAVTSLAFTPQCKLVSAGRDNSLRVWSLKEKGAIADGKPILHRKGNVAQLGVSSDGQWMLFDQGNTLKFYSVEKKNFVHTLSLPTGATPFETLAQFSPDGSLLLTAGAPEGRMQLWRAPDANSRGFEVRQFATRDRAPVTCAAFSSEAGKGGANSFAVSASGQRVYLWGIPTPEEVNEHPIENVRLTLKTHSIDPGTKQTRIGFEVANPTSERYPHGRFEAGRPVTIVID